MQNVWGLIESLQAVSHMPLYKIKSPGNINAFIAFFDQIASFEFIDTSEYTSSFAYWPEMDGFSLNFKNAGFDSSLMVPELGTIFYMLLGSLALALVHVLLMGITLLFPKASCLSDRVRNYLYWNGSIRFFMETYLDFALLALLNVKELDWDLDFWSVRLSNYLAIIVTVLTCTLPVFFLFFYAYKLKKWEDEKFQRKYGALLEGTDQERETSQWVVILVPLSFFVRRMTMSLVLVFWHDFLWGQLALQLYLSIFILIFIGWTRPLDSDFANNMELFNEVIGILSMYCLMLFSDFVGDPEARAVCGYGFIGIVCIFALVHIFILIQDTCSSLYQAIRRKYYKGRNQRIREELIAKQKEKLRQREIMKSTLIATKLMPQAFNGPNMRLPTN